MEIKFKAEIIKIGNSYGIVIPASYIKDGHYLIGKKYSWIGILTEKEEGEKQ